MSNMLETDTFKKFSSDRISLTIDKKEDAKEKELMISEKFSELKNNLTSENIKLLNILDDMLTDYISFAKIESYIQGFKDRSAI